MLKPKYNTLSKSSQTIGFQVATIRFQADFQFI